MRWSAAPAGATDALPRLLQSLLFLLRKPTCTYQLSSTTGNFRTPCTASAALHQHHSQHATARAAATACTSIQPISHQQQLTLPAAKYTTFLTPAKNCVHAASQQLRQPWYVEAAPITLTLTPPLPVAAVTTARGLSTAAQSAQQQPPPQPAGKVAVVAQPLLPSAVTPLTNAAAVPQQKQQQTQHSPALPLPPKTAPLPLDPVTKEQRTKLGLRRHWLQERFSKVRNEDRFVLHKFPEAIAILDPIRSPQAQVWDRLKWEQQCSAVQAAEEWFKELETYNAVQSMRRTECRDVFVLLQRLQDSEWKQMPEVQRIEVLKLVEQCLTKHGLRHSAHVEVSSNVQQLSGAAGTNSGHTVTVPPELDVFNRLAQSMPALPSLGKEDSLFNERVLHMRGLVQPAFASLLQQAPFLAAQHPDVPALLQRLGDASWKARPSHQKSAVVKEARNVYAQLYALFDALSKLQQLYQQRFHEWQHTQQQPQQVRQKLTASFQLRMPPSSQQSRLQWPPPQREAAPIVVDVPQAAPQQHQPQHSITSLAVPSEHHAVVLGATASVMEPNVAGVDSEDDNLPPGLQDAALATPAHHYLSRFYTAAPEWVSGDAAVKDFHTLRRGPARERLLRHLAPSAPLPGLDDLLPAALLTLPQIPQLYPPIQALPSPLNFSHGYFPGNLSLGSLNIPPAYSNTLPHLSPQQPPASATRPQQLTLAQHVYIAAKYTSHKDALYKALVRRLLQKRAIYSLPLPTVVLLATLLAENQVFEGRNHVFMAISSMVQRNSSNIQDMTAEQAHDLVHAFSVMHLTDPFLFRLLAQRLIGNLHGLSPSKLVNILWAYTSRDAAARSDDNVTGGLVTAVLQSLSTCSIVAFEKEVQGRNLVRLLTAVASYQRRAPPPAALLDRCAQRLAEIDSAFSEREQQDLRNAVEALGQPNLMAALAAGTAGAEQAHDPCHVTSLEETQEQVQQEEPEQQALQSGHR